MEKLKISYLRENDKHIINTDHISLGQIVIDHSNVASEDRKGVAKQFVAIASVYCYCATLADAMETRGLKYKNIQATAELVTGKNEKNANKILNISIDVQVDIDEADKELFERVQMVMRNGCIVTNSIHDGIEMEYNLRSTF